MTGFFFLLIVTLFPPTPTMPFRRYAVVTCLWNSFEGSKGNSPRVKIFSGEQLSPEDDRFLPC